MGALSPATRNAQVAMFMRGEVDYLVATDAVGMGLNMDVAHVAFAGLDKFDGRRERRLTIPEMAQIAGRAGRHQRDGTFGTLGLGGENGPAFTDEEISAIEEHRFRPLDHLYWRSAELDFTDVSALIHSLEARSDDPLLRPSPPGIDLAVLKTLAEDPAIAARRGTVARRLWAACGCPTSARWGRCTMPGWCAGSSTTSPMAGTCRTTGSRPKSAASTMSLAISRRSPTASPGSAAGPISRTEPTGWPSLPDGPSARAMSKPVCPTRSMPR
jgi:hypothetical protein